MRQDSNDPQPPIARFPAEEGPDLGLPGADRPEPPPESRDDLPERLGDRIEREPAGVAAGEPDLLPDVEVPNGQM